MENKLMRSACTCIILGVIVALIIQACKTNKTLASENKTFFVTLPYRPIDTPQKVVKKPLTGRQLQELVRPFFKMNIDTFITPKLDKLSRIINTQALSISDLTYYMKSIQQRNDSIINERNYYRRLWENNQQKSLKYQRQLLDMQQQSMVQQKVNDENNKKQIKFNTIVGIVALIGVIILILMYAALYYQVRKINKKIIPYA